jgi:hypothetical protein
VPGGDITNGSPQLADALACESVVDPSPVSTRVGQATLGKQPQMVRGRRDALASLARDLLYRPLALREQVDDLRPPSAGQRCRYGRERIEEGGLRREVSDMLKLSFEHMNVKLTQGRHAGLPANDALGSSSRPKFAMGGLPDASGTVMREARHTGREETDGRWS